MINYMKKLINSVVSFREKLEKNRIFLDVILTGFVIFLAFSANKIAEQQNYLAYLDKRPNFIINN